MKEIKPILAGLFILATFYVFNERNTNRYEVIEVLKNKVVLLDTKKSKLLTIYK
tara:strand:+ start:850 stop:1011 length:162 start_codon:yes stop_codon:yes gene_type:complete